MLHDIKSCFLLYFDLHISGSSAELSYYFLFSVFPLIMAMSAVTFMNIDGTGMVFSFLEAILPEMVTELLSDFYDYLFVSDFFLSKEELEKEFDSAIAQCD